ncbi:MAG: pyruvate ferredoxin oxidoreductase [Myxococcales bacterium]|nr:pyruvate ferredoxin oxidoreductase [Myxococcales bacterium]
MIEIRFHGRGGQGAVIASKVMAVALFMEGQWVQSFPKFGVERRGAPVEAFLRIDQEKILLRNNVYSPDHVVVLDPTLMEATDVTSGLRKGGILLINTTKKPADFPQLAAFKVACVDASAIAAKNRLGSPAQPIVNTSILGACAKAMGLVSIDSICKAIEEEVPIKPAANATAARQAYEQVIL